MKDADDAEPAISQAKLFDLSIDLLCIAGTDGRFKLVNPAFEQTLGWSREELLRRPFYELVHPDDRAATEREVEKLASGVPTISFENRYLCADGSYKLLRWNTKPDITTGLLYAVAHDVTEQRRMEAELVRAKDAAEASVRRRTELVASISHEIRTPMNGIIGMVEIALQSAVDPSVRRNLEIARGSAEHLVELIEDLLDLSRIEAGRLELDEEPFRVRETVDAVIQALAWAAQVKELELVYHVGAEVPSIVAGDAARLRQILVNLVGNAIKFTDRGSVMVEVTRETELASAVRLRFSIRDTGVGIPEDRQAEVFERFAQIPGPDGRRRDGSGLGLPITVQLVELMGGSLELASKPGQGSTFQVSLPFRLVPLESATAEQPQHLEGVALVVGRRAATRDLVARYLEAWGFEVERAADLAEAAARLAVARPNGRQVELCVLDGRSLGAGLDAWAGALGRGGGSVPRLVAIVSSSDSPAWLDAIRLAGVAAHVVEPVSESELLAAVSGRAPAAESSADSGLGRLRVLVAEDGEVNREVLRGLLESRGHSVEMVDDGEAAVAAAARGRFDVALLDLELPSLGGIAAARRIRAAEQGSGRRLQIVAITAHASAASRQQSLEAGMDDFLSKPITATRLFESLARAKAAAAMHRAAASAGPDEAGVIDWSAALRFCGGQEFLLRQVAAAARQQVPVLLREAKESIARRDGDRLRRAAHTLKSTFGYFGAHELRRQAERLESLAWEARFEQAAQLLQQGEAAVSALLKELHVKPEEPESETLAGRREEREP